MKEISQTERAATVQILLVELEGLEKYAEQALDQKWVDRTELKHRFRAINNLVNKAGVGTVQIDDSGVDESAVAERGSGDVIVDAAEDDVKMHIDQDSVAGSAGDRPKTGRGAKGDETWGRKSVTTLKGKATVTADRVKTVPATAPDQPPISNVAGEEKRPGLGTTGDDDERTPESGTSLEQSPTADASGADQTPGTESRADDVEPTTEPAATPDQSPTIGSAGEDFRPGTDSTTNDVEHTDDTTSTPSQAPTANSAGSDQRLDSDSNSDNVGRTTEPAATPDQVPTADFAGEELGSGVDSSVNGIEQTPESAATPATAPGQPPTADSKSGEETTDVVSNGDSGTKQTQLATNLPATEAKAGGDSTANERKGPPHQVEEQKSVGDVTSTQTDKAKELTTGEMPARNSEDAAKDNSKPTAVQPTDISDQATRGSDTERTDRKPVLVDQKMPPVRRSRIAWLSESDYESFGITFLCPNGVSLIPFISVVSPTPEYPLAQVTNVNYSGAETLHKAVTEFVGSWKRYLKHVPRALSYCGPSGLRFLSHEDVAEALGLSSEQLDELDADWLSDDTVAAGGKGRPSASDLYSLLLEKGLPSFTDDPTYCLRPVDRIGEESFYDPIEVAQFAAECIDPLIARAKENFDPNATDDKS